MKLYDMGAKGIVRADNKRKGNKIMANQPLEAFETAVRTRLYTKGLEDANQFISQAALAALYLKLQEAQQ